MEAPGRHEAARRSYDAVAAAYADGFRDELARKPLDRALLCSLAEQAGDGVPVADLGCRPGHVAGWLARHGVAAVGVDLSGGMIDVARREHPEAEFRTGDLLAAPARDGEFGVVVALYSVIHLGPGELPAACAEMHRVLRPGGLALVSFHIGAEVRHLAEWWGHEVDLDFRFLETPEVARAMEEAGLAVQARLERTSCPGEVDTRRGYLLGRRDDR
jgi:SAM-dependent methyltransferase